jgi:hypothetical protein
VLTIPLPENRISLRYRTVWGSGNSDPANARTQRNDRHCTVGGPPLDPSGGGSMRRTRSVQSQDEALSRTSELGVVNGEWLNQRGGELSAHIPPDRADIPTSGFFVDLHSCVSGHFTPPAWEDLRTMETWLCLGKKHFEATLEA